jgi:hypothetical protein
MSHILMHFRECCLNHRAVAIINKCDGIRIRSTFILILLIALFHVAIINNCDVTSKILEIIESQLWTNSCDNLENITY